MTAREEFYVGYQPQAPTGLGRFLKWLTAGLWLTGMTVAAVVVLGQQPFAAAVFEFGTVRAFEGTLVTAPVPMLVVERPGASAATSSAYALVNPGKVGVTGVDHLNGQRVRVDGTLIYRDDQTMIEIVPATLAAVGAGRSPKREVVNLGEHRFVGEIVDSKCFLGVMNPGHLKPHRACATRCISGGIPPILLVRRPDGTARHLLLVGPEGEAINKQVLEYVAEPVEISGHLERHWDRLVLKIDPRQIRRL